jgi:probable phosphoglycerate mutase
MRRPVYLVRHGQSAWNAQRLTQGQISHPRLTPRGREQAHQAADKLMADLADLGHPAERVVSSDLVRAVETADVVSDRLGLAHELDRRLREQHLGWLEGRPYEETWAAADEHDWSDPTLPVAGGEAQAAFHARIAAVLADVDPETVTVLVTHGDAIRAAAAIWAGHRSNEAPWLTVENGSVLRFDGTITEIG